MADIIIVGEQIVLDYGSASDSATLTETVRIFVGTNDSFTLSESAGAAVSNSSNDSGTCFPSITIILLISLQFTRIALLRSPILFHHVEAFYEEHSATLVCNLFR